MNYAFAFIIAFGLAYIITPFLKRLNGNVSIYFATLVTSLLFLKPDIRLLGISIIGAGIVLLGIIEEKRGLPSWTISLGLLLCSVFITLFGIKIKAGPFDTYPGLLSIPITVLWFMFVIGVMSVISKIDGLIVYITLILCSTFFIISIFRKEDTIFHTTLCITFTSSLLGILKYDPYPAKIKMGNTSFLGFMIGILTVIGEDLKTVTSIILSVPILLLCVPVLIVVSSIIRSFISGGVFKSSRKFLIEDKKVSHCKVSDRISILGIEVDKITMDKVIKRIDGFIKTNFPHMVVALNSYLIAHVQKDKELRDILKQADLIVPDGLSLIWAAEFYGDPLPERITGIDLMNNLCRLARDKGYTIYLLSGKNGGAAYVAKNLAVSFEGLKIVGEELGYFNKEEERRIIKRINTCSPDILFVGLGQITGEKWIKRNLPRLQVKVAIGISEAIDVISGRVKRPPAFMLNRYLEWLYKVYSQPRRLIRLYNLLNFVFQIFIHKIELNLGNVVKKRKRSH
ncbi:MAG: WecB/TagA/CpsF family glycosyltransferase [bacterium]|nr:WecB/TagA/CpsF family glycosyltransferase [bacterium]